MKKLTLSWTTKPKTFFKFYIWFLLIVLSAEAKSPLLVWSTLKSKTRTSGIYSAPALPAKQTFIRHYILSKRIISLRLPHSVTSFDSNDDKHEIVLMDVGRGNLAIAGLDSKGIKRNHRGITTKAKAIAVDWNSGNIYWTDQNHEWIFTTTPDFKHTRPVVRNIEKPRGIAVYPQKGLLFWSQQQTKDKGAKIMKSTLSGYKKHVVATVQGRPTSIAIDYAEDRLYWIDTDGMKVWYASINGVEGPTLIFHNNSLSLKDLHVFREWVYITSSMTNQILMLNKTSGEVLHTIFTSSPAAVAVIGGGAQPKSPGPCDINNGGCDHFCFAQPPGNMRKCGCSIGMQLGRDGTSCKSVVMKKDFLLVVDSDMQWIFQISRNGKSFTKLDLPGLVIPVQVEYDATTARVYWSDVGSTSINKANVDGSNHIVLAKDQIHQPTGIALDSTSRNLYWTDEGIGTINVIRTDGTHRKTLLHQNISLPRGLVIDPDSGWMWWSDWGKKTIERSSMDGSGRMVIVDEHVEWVNGITLDREAQRIYWCDAKRDVIESSGIDGSNRQIVKRFPRDTAHVFGITIFKGYLYWSDWNKPVISKMKIDGNTVEDFGPRIFDKASDVHSSYVSRTKGTNPCLIGNGNCTGLCIPVPYSPSNPTDRKTTRVCMCGNEYNGTCDKPTNQTDGEPPNFNGTCPQPITLTAPTCKEQVLVDYLIPKAIDNSGKVRLELPIQSPPLNLSEGMYEHRYTAVDEAGNHDTCIVIIVVNVIHCPEVHEIFKNQPFKTTNTSCGNLYGTQMAITCINGTTSSRSEFIECGQDGKWIGNPVCVSSAQDKPTRPVINPTTSTERSINTHDVDNNKDESSNLPPTVAASTSTFPFLFVIPMVAALLLTSACAIGYRYHRSHSLPIMEAMEKTLSYRKNEDDTFTLDVSEERPQTSVVRNASESAVADIAFTDNPTFRKSSYGTL